MATSDVLRSRLELQGFDCARNPELLAMQRWLRFTPTMSTILIVTGTALRSPTVLWIFAGITIVGAAGWNLFDFLFTAGIRHLVGAPAIRQNPAPRRFAMMIAAIWAASAGWLISSGMVTAGVVLGAGLAVAGGTVALTHFCIGSWVYRLLRLPSATTG